jgi:subtilisin family serine protease
MAAEWADKNGADIINSSLGYTFQRYLPEQMNGKTAFVTRAAQFAVDKGILVVLSAGNEGESSWKRVTAPGDATGALTVGGIDPSTGIHIGFSSYGPSWDKRLKPEVTAYGRALVASKNGFATAEGTSFSSPLVAGFAACLKQKYPDITNTKLKEIICQSGDLWPYYDYAHGYGVPQPGFLKPDTTTSVEQFDIVEDSYSISIFPKDHLKDTTLTPSLSDTLTESARDSIAQLIVNSIFHKNNYMTAWPDVLFYHIKNKKGYLDRYYVLDLEDEENGSVTINKSIADRPFSIGIYYRGNYREIVVP